jgi:hypothetical protein
MLLEDFVVITNLTAAFALDEPNDRSTLARRLARFSLLLLGADALTPNIVARVWGENEVVVIGHGIGGTNFPDIMARLAKMQDRWVSDDRPVCHHPISRPVKSVMAKRSTYVDVTYYREFLT